MERKLCAPYRLLKPLPPGFMGCSAFARKLHKGESRHFPENIRCSALGSGCKELIPGHCWLWGVNNTVFLVFSHISFMEIQVWSCFCSDWFPGFSNPVCWVLELVKHCHRFSLCSLVCWTAPQCTSSMKSYWWMTSAMIVSGPFCVNQKHTLVFTNVNRSGIGIPASVANFWNASSIALYVTQPTSSCHFLLVDRMTQMKSVGPVFSRSP